MRRLLLNMTTAVAGACATGDYSGRPRITQQSAAVSPEHTALGDGDDEATESTQSASLNIRAQCRGRRSVKLRLGDKVDSKCKGSKKFYPGRIASNAEKSDARGAENGPFCMGILVTLSLSKKKAPIGLKIFFPS